MREQKIYQDIIDKYKRKTQRAIHATTESPQPLIEG